MFKNLRSEISNNLISVLMPNYNHGDFIELAITNILRQSYKNIEIIIVDDCSTDISRSIIEQQKKKDERVKCYFSEERKGANRSIEIALEKAQGEYIFSCSADDYLCDFNFFYDAIYSIEFFNCVGCFSKTRLIDGLDNSELNIIGHSKRGRLIKKNEFIRLFLKSEIFVPGSSSIWRAREFREIWNIGIVNLGGHSDYFANHAIPLKGNIYFLDKVSANMRYFQKSFGNSVDDQSYFTQLAQVENLLRTCDLNHHENENLYISWRNKMVQGRLRSNKIKKILKVIDFLLGVINVKYGTREETELSSIKAYIREKKLTLENLEIAALKIFEEKISKI